MKNIRNYSSYPFLTYIIENNKKDEIRELVLLNSNNLREDTIEYDWTMSNITIHDIYMNSNKLNLFKLLLSDDNKISKLIYKYKFPLDLFPKILSNTNISKSL